MFAKLGLILIIFAVLILNRITTADEKCLPAFQIPGKATQNGQTVCYLDNNCTSCCSYNTSCCGYLPCCNGTCCDGECCDINVGTCQKLMSSDSHVCVPYNHVLCGDDICAVGYSCCGAMCVPDGSDCCDDVNPRFCQPGSYCCANGCCDDSSLVCCADYQTCCTTDLPTCCPNTCCDTNSYCCADSCCPNGSDHCGDGYYCASGTHCCGSGSDSHCCDDGIDCCNSGCCSSSSPRCCDSVCWWNGWQPCSSSDSEVGGLPAIAVSKVGSDNCDVEESKPQKSKKCEVQPSAIFVKAITKKIDRSVKEGLKKNDPSQTVKTMSSFSVVEERGMQRKSVEVPKRIGSTSSCLSNSATSTDPCFGFPCFLQITDCYSNFGYLNYFGQGMLCNKEAEESYFNQQGLQWWMCSQSCITSRVSQTLVGSLVPCCNSLDDFGLKFVNPECFVKTCDFCSIYADNYYALEQIFSSNIQNPYWQQLLDFMDECKFRSGTSTNLVQTTVHESESSTGSVMSSTVNTEMSTSTIQTTSQSPKVQTTPDSSNSYTTSDASTLVDDDATTTKFHQQSTSECEQSSSSINQSTT